MSVEYYVYLIQFGEMPYYKIGVAKNVLKRITDFEIGTPINLNLICSAPIIDAYVVEQALHSKFWKLRIKGEWFELTNKEIGFIKNALETLSSKTKAEIKYNL